MSVPLLRLQNALVAGESLIIQAEVNNSAEVNSWFHASLTEVLRAARLPVCCRSLCTGCCLLSTCASCLCCSDSHPTGAARGPTADEVTAGNFSGCSWNHHGPRGCPARPGDAGGGRGCHGSSAPVPAKFSHFCSLDEKLFLAVFCYIKY